MTSDSTTAAAASSSSNTAPDLVAVAFRQKAAFMKNWKPASVPSNRDRLELYAWHKQAVSGDAPSSNSSSGANLTAAERAKYTAWRAKSGTDTVSAMRQYMSEAERQVRVYGYTPPPGNMLEQPQPETTENGSRSTTTQSPQPSRGLAAIPLLCAAASEHRTAYLRRVQTTPMHAAWWRRQEPLMAVPGSIAALPEQVLLWVATANEHIALLCAQHQQHKQSQQSQSQQQRDVTTILCAVVQSALWPLHNALLAVWMGVIVSTAVLQAAVNCAATILLGSRRTGLPLLSTWNDTVVFAAQSVHTLTESHQPVAARVVGLALTPLPVTVLFLQRLFRSGVGTPTVSTDASSSQYNYLAMACVYTALVVSTVWYWTMVLPWFFSVIVLGTALLLGNCFGVIELAAQI